MHIIRFINNNLGAVFGALLCYYGILSISTMSRSAQESGSEIPMYVFYLLSLSGALMTLEFTRGAIRSLTVNQTVELAEKEGEISNGSLLLQSSFDALGAISIFLHWAYLHC